MPSRALERAGAAKDPQVLWPALAFAARVFVASDRGRAEKLAPELLSEWEEHDLGIAGDVAWLSDLAVVLVALGGEYELGTLVDTIRGSRRHGVAAAAAYVSGDFQAAAAEYGAIGALPEEAYARLRAAERSCSEGRRAEADAELEACAGFLALRGCHRVRPRGRSASGWAASADRRAKWNELTASPALK